MRISILGASGKVGKALVALVNQTPGTELAEAISNTGRDGTVSLADADLENCDVVIDFSTPAGVMALLDQLAGSALPLVIGTTGFSEEQAARIEAEANNRPILVGANFTKGFESFAAAALSLANTFPDASVTVGEIYNINKKASPSGTTQRLLLELGENGRKIETDIGRVGDTPGVNSVEIDYGVARLRVELTVRSRDAYAAGSLDAALWIIEQPNGYYQPKDMISA